MPRAEAAVPSTRERLLGAAREQVEEDGYALASVAAIAARAGLATGGLYRHFPSKAALFVEVFREAGEAVLAQMLAAQSHHVALADRLDAVVSTFAESAMANRRLAWALVYEPVEPLVDAERLAYRRRYRDHMAALLASGIAVGEIPEQDPDLAAAALVGAIAEALVGPLSPAREGPAGPDAQTIARLQAFCRRAIGVEENDGEGAPAAPLGNGGGDD